MDHYAFASSMHTPTLPLRSEPERDPIQSRFEAFAAEHQWMTIELIRVARYYKRIGRTRIGMKHLIEVMRYEYAMRTQDDVELKINNDFTSRYARLVSELAPDVASLFECRRLRTQ